MPRRDAADDEDMMTRCPRCHGRGQIYSIRQQTHIDCPVCTGSGRVNQATYAAFHRGLLPDE